MDIDPSTIADPFNSVVIPSVDPLGVQSLRKRPRGSLDITPTASAVPSPHVTLVKPPKKKKKDRLSKGKGRQDDGLDPEPVLESFPSISNLSSSEFLLIYISLYIDFLLLIAPTPVTPANKSDLSVLAPPIASGESSSILKPSVVDGALSDSSDESFSVVNLGFGQRLGPLETQDEWEVTFEQSYRDLLYFGDYLAPFRQLLRSLQDSSPREQSLAISALTVGAFILSAFTLLLV